MVKRLPLFVAVIGMVLSSAHGAAANEFHDPELQARYSLLTHRLRCLQCQDRSIAESPVRLAGDMRRRVQELLLEGKSDEDVRGFMVARYGEFILIRPWYTTESFWLWLAALTLLLIGIVTTRRRLEPRHANEVIHG